MAFGGDLLPSCHPPSFTLVLQLRPEFLGLAVQVYTGGIGSYALLVMVAAFLMLHPSRQVAGGAVEASLGVLLLDFFRLFGRVLNTNNVGISCRSGLLHTSVRKRWGMLHKGRTPKVRQHGLLSALLQLTHSTRLQNIRQLE